MSGDDFAKLEKIIEKRLQIVLMEIHTTLSTSLYSLIAEINAEVSELSESIKNLNSTLEEMKDR